MERRKEYGRKEKELESDDPCYAGIAKQLPLRGRLAGEQAATTRKSRIPSSARKGGEREESGLRKSSRTNAMIHYGVCE